MIHIKLTPTIFYSTSEFRVTSGCFGVHAANNSYRFSTASVLTNGYGSDDREKIKDKDALATKMFVYFSLPC